jgi:hypothetical protein
MESRNAADVKVTIDEEYTLHFFPSTPAVGPAVQQVAQEKS